MVGRPGSAATLAAALTLVLLASGSGEPADPDSLTRFEYASAAMGTEFRVVFHATDSTAADRAARASFALADRLDSLMSDYRPDSELNRLSDSAGSGVFVPVSDPLWDVLTASVRLSAATDGAFDITVGELTRLWRRAIRRNTLPDEAAIREALRGVGYRSLRFDSTRRAVRIVGYGTRLDPGGIAKGYAADRMLDLLEERGFPAALVDAGGDVAVGAAPPGRSGWSVIASDGAGSIVEPVAIPALSHRGVATSGDSYRFVESDGVRYSHIVDPATGYGTIHAHSVTVLAPSAAMADALASAFSVLPMSRALDIAGRFPGVEARIIPSDDGSPGEPRTTEAFPESGIDQKMP